MIRLKNNWAIDADSKNYRVGVITTSKNRKTGEVEEIFKTKEHASSIEHALKIVMRAEKKKIVSEQDLTLSEAIEAFSKLQAEFEEYLKDIPMIGPDFDKGLIQLGNIE